MIGVSLSRWTMSFFACALLALLIAEGLIALGIGYPAVPVEAAGTLILVHVVAIGWLTLLMCGALLQFLPVLVAQPLHSDALSLPALGALVLGLLSLIAGFLQYGGHIAPGTPFFPAAAILLAIGILLILWNIGRTMIAATEIPLPTWFVIGGLVGVAFAVGLGAIFALVLGGATDARALTALLTDGLPIHIIAGIIGWLTFTAVGVSYRLLAMFMLAPELDGRTTRAAFWLGVLALVIAIPGGIIAVILGIDLRVVLAAALVPGVIAAGFYCFDMRHLYRARKRPRIELNSSTAALSLISFGIMVVLALGLLAIGRFTAHVPAVLFLAAFGWLTGLGLAQLYKITAFLTWLECYGPVLGKAPTPRVQDLVIEGRAAKWFGLYFIAVWGGTIALLIPFPAAFRYAGAAMLVATLGLVGEFVRTRRLADISPERPGGRFPAGARHPRLFMADEG